LKLALLYLVIKVVGLSVSSCPWVTTQVVLHATFSAVFNQRL
jgi:hypothetical protein